MDPLKSLVIAASLLVASPAAAQSGDRWSGYIAEASERFGVPEEWIRRVMRAESGGRTLLNGRAITSRAGAMGLMQLMPETWREMREAQALGPDPHDPHDNIIAGTAYLRAMYDRFGYPGLFGAYNAGPARYGDHVARGRRLPAETIAYVAAVASGAIVAPPAVKVLSPPPPPRLFAVMATAREEPAAEETGRSAAAAVLFVRTSRPEP